MADTDIDETDEIAPASKVRAGLESIAEAIEAIEIHAVSIDGLTRAMMAISKSIEVAGSEIARAILNATRRNPE